LRKAAYNWWWFSKTVFISVLPPKVSGQVPVFSNLLLHAQAPPDASNAFLVAVLLHVQEPFSATPPAYRKEGILREDRSKKGERGAPQPTVAHSRISDEQIVNPISRL
jgi:hypothetical protein